MVPPASFSCIACSGGSESSNSSPSGLGGLSSGSSGGGSSSSSSSGGSSSGHLGGTVATLGGSVSTAQATGGASSAMGGTATTLSTLHDSVLSGVTQERSSVVLLANDSGASCTTARAVVRSGDHLQATEGGFRVRIQPTTDNAELTERPTPIISYSATFMGPDGSLVTRLLPVDANDNPTPYDWHADGVSAIELSFQLSSAMNLANDTSSISATFGATAFDTFTSLFPQTGLTGDYRTQVIELKDVPNDAPLRSLDLALDGPAWARMRPSGGRWKSKSLQACSAGARTAISVNATRT